MSATLAELVAAAQGYPKPDRALLARARAGREATDHGADPELTLALVVWPSDDLLAALEHAAERRVSAGRDPVAVELRIS